MSNVSIFEKKWIDLVFEGKNKAYGAYQLRQESPRTTLSAFFYAILFIGLLSGASMLFSSFKPKPDTDFIPVIEDSLTVVKIENIIEEEPEKPKVEPKRVEQPETEVAPVNKPFEVAPTPKADPDVPKNDDVPKVNPPAGGTEPGTGGTPTAPGGGGGTDDGGDKPAPPAGPVISSVLDRQPEFPGGMKKFYTYVGENFEKPEIENIESLTVHVSFVIERDGSMTDIRVLRNPGYSLDKEAIRVLKSLKTKWKPGVLNGQNVRTQYTLPITVRLRE